MRILHIAPSATFAALTLFALTAPADAADERLLRNLRKLEPATRLEQVCDLEAMTQLGKRGIAADRAKSDVISRPQYKSGTLTANGAAYRTRGKWYQLSFTCKANPDVLKVTSFDFKVGKEIPPAKWPALGLWR